MSFKELRLAEPIVRAVAAQGYTTPTPIQTKAIPEALAGRDVLGCAQTGTGKTGAFALPILHRLAASPSRPARHNRKGPRAIRSVAPFQGRRGVFALAGVACGNRPALGEGRAGELHV